MILSQNQSQSSNLERPSPAASASPRPAERDAKPRTLHPRLLACVDDCQSARTVLAHAMAVGRSLGFEVTLARVCKEAAQPAVPADPIEWQLQRQEQRRRLHSLADLFGGANRPESVLLTGDPADELIDWSKVNDAKLLALGTREEHGQQSLGSTALHILDEGHASLLLIPPQADDEIAHYRRILVPIDGSARAESVLPVARRIARAHGAELVLAHVVPQASGQAAFRDVQLGNLPSEIERQQERAARSQLDQLKVRTMEDGLAVRTIVTGPADPRQAVCRVASEENIDLVVMSSHGTTALSDVACGSVAEYMSTHAPMPVLMVRPSLATGLGAPPQDSDGQSVFNFG